MHKKKLYKSTNRKLFVFYTSTSIALINLLFKSDQLVIMVEALSKLNLIFFLAFNLSQLL